jgi:hypothetical protein
MNVFFMAEAQRGHFSRNFFLISSRVRVMSVACPAGAGFTAGVTAGFVGDMTAAACVAAFAGFARFAAFLADFFVRFRADFLAAAGLADIWAILVIDY